MPLSIQEFCGLASNASYEVYVDADHTFGRCFLWTTFTYVSNLLLALICVIRLCLTKRHSTTTSMFLPTATTMVAFLTAVAHLAEVVVSYAVHSRQQHPPAYVLAKGLGFAAWLLCGVLLSVTGRSMTQEKKTDVKYVLSAVVVVVLSSAFHLQYVDKHITSDNITVDNIPVDYVGVLVTFTLNVVFFLLCVSVSLSKVVVGSLNTATSTDDVVAAAEIMQLGQAETTRNPFSRLVFWWSHQLLAKGFKRQINEPADLFSLPENLNTENMKRIMMEKLTAEKDKLTDELKADGVRVTEKTSIDVSLFRVLNQCFGKVFYSLAFLKFFQVYLISKKLGKKVTKILACD